MIRLARGIHHGIAFVEGSLLALDVADASWAGVVSMYSIIHLPPQRVDAALREFHRVLRPNGQLLLAFHGGNEQIRVEEWFGHPVSLQGYLFEPAEIVAGLESVGFVVDVCAERRPDPAFEVATRRIYILAHKPPG